MRTNKTLDEVLAKVTPSLKEKIEHSVNLLRKAEKLALTYDAEDGFFLAFSAGKDSQALYHIAELAGVRFKGHMNLTSVDPPEVIRFAKQHYPEVERMKPHDSIFNIAVQRGILPTMRVRWCCAEYKETAGAGKVTLIGIRHSESIRRSNRKEVEISDHKYSGDLEGLDEYRRKKMQKKRGRKPKEQPKFNIMTASGESQAGCISGKESLLISPIIDWEERDVWEFLRIMEVPHCSLYDEGWKRLGCIGCPMSSAKHKKREEARWPHVKRNWIKAIIKIRRGGYHKSNVPTTRPTSESGRATSSIRGGAEPQRAVSPVQKAGTRGHLRGRYGMGITARGGAFWNPLHTSAVEQPRFFWGGGFLEAPTQDMSLRESGLPGTAIGGY